MDKTQVKEGRQVQRAAEALRYTLTTTPWASSPTSVTVTVTDLTGTNAIVTGTVTSGSASVAGDVITLPIIQNLTAGHLYRVDIQFTAGGNTWAAYLQIQAVA